MDETPSGVLTNKINIMTKELTIGTKVSYNKVSLKNGETTRLESIVKGFLSDGSHHYVCLENGDKMFKEALTILDDSLEQLHIQYLALIQKAWEDGLKSGRTIMDGLVIEEIKRFNDFLVENGLRK